MFRVEVGSGEVTRVTADDGAYTDLNPDPDGRYLYALRAAVDSPPTPVRIDLTTGPNPARLDCPGVPVTLPGVLRRSPPPRRTASRSGPGSCCPRAPRRTSPRRCCSGCTAARMSSWNTWSWRWNPWLMVARGYAVLLPDPALSTGYGLGLHRPRRTASGAPGRTPTSWRSPTPPLARPDLDADADRP